MKRFQILAIFSLTILVLTASGFVVKTAVKAQSNNSDSTTGLLMEYLSDFLNEFTLYLPIVIGGGAAPSPTPEPTPDEMVYVPASDFQMGCENDPSVCYEPQFPLHTVYLDAYYIDKHEVTHDQYKECVTAGECDPPKTWSNEGDYPVIYVSWHNAQDYCTWNGKRLPTEAEWEKAARGDSDTRFYPWGSGIDCTYANYLYRDGWDFKEYCTGFTTPVGSYPKGASPYGALDMAGNVWEWVADWFQEDYYSTYPADGWPSNPTGPENGTLKVLRGGGWATTRGVLSVRSRGNLDPAYRSNAHGYG